MRISRKTSSFLRGSILALVITVRHLAVLLASVSCRTLLHFSRRPLRLLAFQHSQGGQGVVHFSSLVARNPCLIQCAGINGVFSSFHPSLQLLRIKLKNRGS